MKHEQVILGQCPAKSNQYRIITVAGHASLKKSDAVKTFEDSFYLQCCKYRNKKIKGFFEFYIDAYFQSNRSDLDNVCKLTLDMLCITVYTVHMNSRVADADLYIRVLKGVESDGAV